MEDINYILESTLDTMYIIGFDYNEENSIASGLSFAEDYIDGKYKVNLYIDTENSDYIIFKKYNVFLQL